MTKKYNKRKPNKRKPNKRKPNKRKPNKKQTKNGIQRQVKKQDINIDVSQNNKTEQRKNQRDRTYKKKTDYLLSQNISIEGLTKTQINSIKIADIEKGNVTEKNYPFLQGRIFDFDAPRKLKNNKRLYFAYKDFSQNRSFNELLSDYSGLSKDALIAHFNELARRKPMYRKKKRKKGGNGNESNGQAGSYKFGYTSQSGVTILNNDTYNSNRRKPKKAREHSGQYKGWQVLKSNGRISIDEASPRKILEVGAAIMSGITEWERVSFYNQYYQMIKVEFTELIPLIPKPLI